MTSVTDKIPENMTQMKYRVIKFMKNKRLVKNYLVLEHPHMTDWKIINNYSLS